MAISGAWVEDANGLAGIGPVSTGGTPFLFRAYNTSTGTSQADISIAINTVMPQATVGTTTGTAYSAGDLVGIQLSWSSVFRSTQMMHGVLQSVTIADKSTMQAKLDLVFFHTNTTGTTYTDNAEFTLADGDAAKIIGHVSITTGDYIAFANNGLATKSGFGLPISATTDTTLYGALICRSTAPNYTSTGDLIVTIGILQD